MIRCLSFGAAAALLGAAVVVPAGANGPGPAGALLADPDRFMAEVRQRLDDDETRQRDYAFFETRVEQKLDDSGKATEESRKVFESVPGLPGEDRWRRLIEEDGEPVSAEELARQDEARRQRLAEQRAARATGQSEAAPAPRSRTQARIDEAFRVFEFEVIGRERKDGHDTVVVALRPRPDAKPTTREGRIMRHFHGRAWVSESDHELVRLEAEALSDVSIGLGIVGRVHKGSRYSFERQPTADGTWLPVRSSYAASARVLLVRRIRMAGLTEYTNYRRVPRGGPAAEE